MRNQVFQIERRAITERWVQDRAVWNAEQTVFQGHFPEQHVVPGVCTMNMVKQCIADAVELPVQYEYINECKFLNAIVPTEHKHLDVKISMQLQKEEMQITAEVTAPSYIRSPYILCLVSILPLKS